MGVALDGTAEVRVDGDAVCARAMPVLTPVSPSVTAAVS